MIAKYSFKPWVCMYVLLYVSGTGMYHRCHFMKNILQYHKLYATNKCEFLLLRESPSFWHLDVHPNCFLGAVCSEGERTLRFWLLICERKSHKVTDSMSRPPEFILWCELVGHSIVVHFMCFVNFGKSNQL